MAGKHDEIRGKMRKMERGIEEKKDEIKGKKRLGRIVPPAMRLPIALALIVNMIAYYGTRLIAGDFYHYDLTTGFDERIPVIPWTIVIYWGCYLYWVVNYVIGSRQKAEKAYRFFAADFFAKVVCLIVFLVFPTTNVRPELTGNGVFTELMRALYAVDAADNLFPSIHCLTSWFCYIAVRDNEKISPAYRWISFLITLFICLSTLTTKQHVIADAAGGIILAEGSYLLAGHTKFGGWYQKWVGKIEEFISKKD